ncbi:hypothetical protein F5X99DRAFT_365709 [Biscogniauxia marginata]|nr:hypothetical protein F5X99DRAFT_365709 [Biscogniauxia marginata]
MGSKVPLLISKIKKIKKQKNHILSHAMAMPSTNLIVYYPLHTHQLSLISPHNSKSQPILRSLFFPIFFFFFSLLSFIIRHHFFFVYTFHSPPLPPFIPFPLLRHNLILPFHPS